MTILGSMFVFLIWFCNIVLHDMSFEMWELIFGGDSDGVIIVGLG